MFPRFSNCRAFSLLSLSPLGPFPSLSFYLGPYRLTANLTPVFNPYTWCYNFSCVFVDNPRNTGYSYANNYCTDYTCYANDGANFFEQFLPAFNLTNVDFYITGESYGGHYVPAIAGEIFNRNPHTNLKGIAIGNGFVDPPLMVQGYPDLMYNTGLLDDMDYLVAKSYVANITALLNQNDYINSYHLWDAFLNGDTTVGGAWFANVTGLSDYFNYAEVSQPVEFGYSSQYMTQQFVRDAIGVGNQPFQDGNVNVEINLFGDVLLSQKFNIASLLTGGIKVMLYNGHLDIICGAILTNAYVPTIEWPGQPNFNQVKRTIWIANDGSGDVNGWVRQYNNLVQTVVHSCGHICPYDTPARTQDMITRFILDQSWN